MGVAKADDKILSIGVLGHVFTTFTSKDIKEKIGDYLKNIGSEENVKSVSSALDDVINNIFPDTIPDGSDY